MMFLQHFFDTYTKNYEKAIELDGAVLEISNYESWNNDFVTRSEAIREIFNENVKLLDELNEFLKDDPSEYADDLFNVINDLYFGQYDDLFVIKTMIDKLLPYYESKGDIEKQVFLCAVLAFENFEFYGRISGNEGEANNLADPYKKVVSFEPYYDKIQNRDIRNRISAAYSNLIAPIAQYHEETRKQIFNIYDRAYKLYNEHVAPMGDRTESEFCSLIDADMLFMEEHIDELNDSEVIRLGEIVNKLKNNPEFEDEEGNLFRAEQTLAIYRKEKTVEQVIEEYISYIKELPYPDYKNLDDNTNLLYILNFYNCAETIFSLVEKHEISSEKISGYVNQFLKPVTNVLTSIPYSFETAMCNNLCSEWFHVSEQYLDSIDMKKSLLFDMILCRQPITYIHSLMVEKIAIAIANTIIDVNPSLLIGAAHTKDSREVVEKRNEVLKFISDCAMMHDIGKCAVADVINKQTRKLNDVEFGIIKLHPEKALHVINNDKAFEDYTDVMIGHHKSYDGKFGYPSHFDNSASKTRNVIDLITICDSIDAATDIFGRNYTKGKSFDTVFGELQKFSGDRYNGEMVKVIENNESLYKNLSEITSTKRKDIYYEAYEKILGLH